MSAIAGIAHPGKSHEVNHMLEKMAHRGPMGQHVIETETATLGMCWTHLQSNDSTRLEQSHTAWDRAGEGHYALAQASPGGLRLERDPLGIAPLYYGHARDGALCFASEVKGLLLATQDVHEFPPGHWFDGQNLAPSCPSINLSPLTDSPDDIARELRRRLEVSVLKHIGNGEVGAWLSGGLDSSTMAVLARSHVRQLHTFVAGIAGAPDLEYARQVAEFLHTDHHEVIVNFEEMLAALPDVIYHLESFDALLVRSSITNYLVAQRAAEYVPAVFSGEGGDELFAGYEYLKTLDPALLPSELVDITARLHNTALQRVDRCASAHGTVAHVGFLDPDVLEYAQRIPTDLKLHHGVEKWILRQAMAGALPDSVLNRPKSKFWQGAGVEDLLAEYANEKISDTDFQRERQLPNGWVLNTKEELLYYRIFREYFGILSDFSWMGRTKGAPVA